MSVFAFKALKTVSTCAVDLLVGVAAAKRPKARSTGARIRAMNMLLNGASSGKCWEFLLEDEELRWLKDGFYTENPPIVTTNCAILDYRVYKARKYSFSVCIVPPTGGQPFGVCWG